MVVSVMLNARLPASSLGATRIGTGRQVETVQAPPRARSGAVAYVHNSIHFGLLHAYFGIPTLKLPSNRSGAIISQAKGPQPAFPKRSFLVSIHSKLRYTMGNSAFRFPEGSISVQADIADQRVIIERQVCVLLQRSSD